MCICMPTHDSAYAPVMLFLFGIRANALLPHKNAGLQGSEVYFASKTLQNFESLVKHF